MYAAALADNIGCNVTVFPASHNQVCTCTDTSYSETEHCCCMCNAASLTCNMICHKLFQAAGYCQMRSHAHASPLVTSWKPDASAALGKFTGSCTFIWQVLECIWEEALVEALWSVPFHHHLQSLPGAQPAHTLQLDLPPVQNTTCDIRNAVCSPPAASRCR